MTWSSNPALVAFTRGPKGDPGTLVQADLDAATAALKGGVTTGNDTLKKIEDHLALKAPLDSPALINNPTAPTQAVNNNSTKIATTAYADRAATNAVAGRQAQDALLDTISTLSTTISGVLLFTGGVASALTLDMDGTLAANSDTRLATQKAVKTYADTFLSTNDAMIFKGVIDCSANPNYPAADRGFSYKASVAGKIGGASGINVEVGDLIICITDGTVSGTQGGVGANWTIVQANLDGAVIGPASSTSGNFASFSGTSGKLIQDSGKATPSGAVVGTTDTQTLSGKTIAGGSNTLSAIALSSLATQAAFTIAGNNTSGSAVPTAIDIASLTTKASPTASDYVMISDQAASGAWKKVNISALASAGSVSTIAGNTGSFTLSGLLANTTNDLHVVAAVQSDMETATSNTVAVTPGTTKYHPGVAKAWAHANQTGVQALDSGSLNVASLTDTGAGLTQFNFSASMSAATYAACATSNLAAVNVFGESARATGTYTVIGANSGTPTDSTSVSFILMGDL